MKRYAIALILLAIGSVATAQGPAKPQTVRVPLEGILVTQMSLSSKTGKMEARGEMRLCPTDTSELIVIAKSRRCW